MKDLTEINLYIESMKEHLKALEGLLEEKQTQEKQTMETVIDKLIFYHYDSIEIIEDAVLIVNEVIKWWNREGSRTFSTKQGFVALAFKLKESMEKSCK
jgi:hypothetical protein